MTDELKGTGVWSGLKIKREPPKEDDGESKEGTTPAATKSAEKTETNTKQ